MDKDKIGEMLKQLATADGLSGYEDRVRDVVRELLGAQAGEVRSDALGNVIARQRGRVDPAPGRVMLAAHMDEIGMIVSKVDRGFLHVGKVGGVDPRNLIGQEVTVFPSGPGAEKFPDGIPGYIGNRPPHMLTAEERKKVVPLEELRVDIGAPGANAGEGVPQAGVLGLNAIRVGDRVAVRGPYTELLNGRVASKALDNRASVAAMLGALGYLAQMQHSWDVYAVATVQEEIGLRGAITSAFGVAPDVAVAIDVTFGDTPGLDDAETVEMDKGPAISWGPNLHPGVVNALRESARALEISYVDEAVPGGSGTDAWAIQVVREGIPTGLLGIPTRYMHSATEMAVVADIDRTARLLAAFVSRLDDDFLATLPEEV